MALLIVCSSIFSQYWIFAHLFLCGGTKPSGLKVDFQVVSGQHKKKTKFVIGIEQDRFLFEGTRK